MSALDKLVASRLKLTPRLLRGEARREWNEAARKLADGTFPKEMLQPIAIHLKNKYKMNCVLKHIKNELIEAVREARAKRGKNQSG